MRKYRIIEKLLDNGESEFTPEYQEPSYNSFGLDFFEWEVLYYDAVPTYEDAMEVINLDKKFHVGIKDKTIHRLDNEEPDNIVMR